MTKTRQLFLGSNSMDPDSGLFGHCAQALGDFLKDKKVIFIPYAFNARRWDDYAQRIRLRLLELGVEDCRSIHYCSSATAAIAAAEAIFVGGGNTFRLLGKLQRQGLMNAIRTRVVEDGVSYVGMSAGTNVACPTIQTTNDMPIVVPGSMESIGLVPFQINPHYLDADPSSKHQGETRETRLLEYLEENPGPVLGLREGSWLEVSGQDCHLCGQRPVRLFRKGRATAEYEPGSDLSFLLKAT